MKKLFYLLAGFIIIFTVGGCKKDQHYTSGNVATFNVINGIINNDVFIKTKGSINNSGMDNNGGDQRVIYFGSRMFFFTEAKNTDVAVLNNTDSSVMATKNIDFKKGGIYTMLLAGISPSVETVLVDDTNVPKVDLSKTPTDADSIIYFRFINLSPNVQPLDIRITGNSTNEVSGLAYKGYSPWKAYPAKIVNTPYQFQVIENGTVLLTRNFSISPTSTARFKNVSLVIVGLKNGSPSLAVNISNFYL